MSEREIRHFKYGREYIPTGLSGSDTCRLVVLTDDQIEVLSNLVNYAHDRRNWNDETIDFERYYMPSDDDWDNLESLVDNLEYQLMSDLDPIDGDLILGNVTPEWSKLAVSIPGANLINVLAVASADLRPSWKTASSNPGAAAAVLASNATGGIQLALLGVGTAPIAGQLVTVNTDDHSNSGTKVHHLAYMTCSPTVSGAIQHYMTQGKATKIGTTNVTSASSLLVGGSWQAGISVNATGGIYACIGSMFAARNQSTGGATAHELYAAQILLEMTGGTTNAVGIDIPTPVVPGGATNLYGIRMGDFGGGATLSYAIKTGTGKNYLGDSLQVLTGFGCNSKSPQTSYSINADSTDLPTVIALCNQLRAALIANGICV